MKINSISSANFKGIYLAMGYKKSREGLKEDSKNYKNIMCLPVDSGLIDTICNKSVQNCARLRMDLYDEKPMLVITGKQAKWYKEGKIGYDNGKTLLKKAQHIMYLPLFNEKRTLKKIEKDKIKEDDYLIL